MNKYTSTWTREEQGFLEAPHDVRIAVVTAVHSDSVTLDDGEDYLVSTIMKHVEVGQKVIARVPWDGVGYIVPLE